MDDRVVDSRIVKEGRATRRRRECFDCGYRYTTYEFIETSYPSVVKKDGRREPLIPPNSRRALPGRARSGPFPPSR